MTKDVKIKLTLTTAGLVRSELDAANVSAYFNPVDAVPVNQFIRTAYAKKSDVYLVYCEGSCLDFMEAAEDLMSSSPCVVAFVTDEIQEEVLLCCMNSGVAVFNRQELSQALSFLYAVELRLKSWGNQAAKLQIKLDDVKLINRAKLLLMERFKMSEKEAHRYIEKTAMDNSMKRSEVAISIIKTYEA